jgi:hypothetical protein
MVIIRPIPISRSRFNTTLATVINRQAKKAEPIMASARMPAAKDLPRMRADRGVGVTNSLVSTPASRSQMIWIPQKMATNRPDWAMIPEARGSDLRKAWS